MCNSYLIENKRLPGEVIIFRAVLCHIFSSYYSENLHLGVSGPSGVLFSVLCGESIAHYVPAYSGLLAFNLLAGEGVLLDN